jgi:hypothetical protein
MLIVQFPSILHEMGVEALTVPFVTAFHALNCEYDRLHKRWSILRGRENSYTGRFRDGLFISDASIHVRGESLFHIEVAYSQSWPSVRNKAVDIMKGNLEILGVLVLDITEVSSSPWSSPGRRSQPDDFIAERNWMEAAESSKTGPFSRIVVDGHVWLHDIEIFMCLFERTQLEADDGDPERVGFPGLVTMVVLNSTQFRLRAQGNPSFPELEARLQEIWGVIIDKVKGDDHDIDPNLLSINWRMVRNQLEQGALETAYHRYCRWYGGTKRRIVHDEDEG